MLTLHAFDQNKIIEARDILEKIYPSNEVGEEMKALQSSVETEKEAEGSLGDGIFSKMKSAWGNKVVRRGLYAGVTVQVAQQFVGINTVMYYSPTIVQLAGFASNRTALALSLVTTGLNAFGTMLSMLFVDRFGRRRLMIISMVGIITCLVVLSILFFQASVHAPLVGISESNSFGVNYTCSDFKGSTSPSSWNCMTCLRASSGCGFCASNENIVSFNPLDVIFESNLHDVCCNKWILIYFKN
ncbi:putative major facilitator, sugar transporter, MFS transporter superfamily [Helianthus annuus]|nr:putative major facilitator, sugar transporter, MFS transporter superfamily [Helianthus annuus]